VRHGDRRLFRGWATSAATGIGRFQFAVNRLAIALGGHARVGLEDNLWFDNTRTDPASSPRLVERRGVARVSHSPFPEGGNR